MAVSSGSTRKVSSSGLTKIVVFCGLIRIVVSSGLVNIVVRSGLTRVTDVIGGLTRFKFKFCLMTSSHQENKDCSE